MESTAPLTRGRKKLRSLSGETRSDCAAQCAICLDTLMNQRDLTTLPCGHAFHAKCMMETILKTSPRCPMCRTVCARDPEREEEEESSSDDGMDERTILLVADRIHQKLSDADVRTCLRRFRIPNGTQGLSHRELCELLAEQITHETDDEDDASA